MMRCFLIVLLALITVTTVLGATSDADSSDSSDSPDYSDYDGYFPTYDDSGTDEGEKFLNTCSFLHTAHAELEAISPVLRVLESDEQSQEVVTRLPCGNVLRIH